MQAKPTLFRLRRDKAKWIYVSKSGARLDVAVAVLSDTEERPTVPHSRSEQMGTSPERQTKSEQISPSPKVLHQNEPNSLINNLKLRLDRKVQQGEMTQTRADEIIRIQNKGSFRNITLKTRLSIKVQNGEMTQERADEILKCTLVGMPSARSKDSTQSVGMHALAEDENRWSLESQISSDGSTPFFRISAEKACSHAHYFRIFFLRTKQYY